MERVHKLEGPGSKGILGGRERSERDKKAALLIVSPLSWAFCIWFDFFLKKCKKS